MLIYYREVKEKKSTMLLSNISLHSCMIIYYIVEENSRYFLQGFQTAKKLKCHIKSCIKINDKGTIKMPKKDEYVKFKNCG